MPDANNEPASVVTNPPASQPVPAPTQETAPEVSATIATPPKGFFLGTGRRKSAVARVRVRPGDGEYTVNGRKAEVYFCEEKDRKAIIAPLQATETLGKVTVLVNVQGGGPTGQAGAILLGLARAMMQVNGEYETALRGANLLTQDSRIVERKKPGQSGARRRFQFSKR